LFSRDEVELVISSDSIPLDRRVLYALFFFTGVRLGEAAGLLWSDVDDAAAPLKRLSISRSYDGDTKTQTPREVPVHPVLASILAEWKLSGFAAMLGRHPGKDDLLIPSRVGVMRSRNQVRGKFLDDLARLGLRPRRVHDTRRTFITLARVDGARKDVLEPITHSGRGGIMDVYTSLPWTTLCEAVACLKLERLKANVYRLPMAANDGVGGPGELSKEPARAASLDESAPALVTSLVTGPELRARFVQKAWEKQAKVPAKNSGGAGSRTRFGPIVELREGVDESFLCLVMTAG
jgi:hypothetical protein